MSRYLIIWHQVRKDSGLLANDVTKIITATEQNFENAFNEASERATNLASFTGNFKLVLQNVVKL